MTKTDHEALLIAFVNQELLMRDDTDMVAADKELLVSGLLDSIGVMRLVGFIESDLSLPVPPEDVSLENFNSISSILDYIRGKTSCTP